MCQFVHFYCTSLTDNAPGYLAENSARCRSPCNNQSIYLNWEGTHRTIKRVQKHKHKNVPKTDTADTRTLVVSRTSSSSGDRTFATTALQVWNCLLPNLRLCGHWAVIRAVQAVTEDVRPRHGVNCV